MPAIQKWAGEDITDKSILVWSDQGLGDTVQMARYLPMIRAKQIILYVEGPLFNLMRHSFPKVNVVMKGWAFQRTDYHVSLMSLMTIFKASPGNIPQGRYLHPPPKEFYLPDVKYREVGVGRNGTEKKMIPLIGINWQGNKRMARDMARSMPLKFMEPILDCGTIVSLQKGTGQQQAAGYDFIDIMDECIDLCDTAALIDRLDIVITTDTVIPHLAGALGKKTYLLESFETEWRWGMGGPSPWYETVNVFRQKTLGDWPGVVARVRKELHDAS